MTYCPFLPAAAAREAVMAGETQTALAEIERLAATVQSARGECIRLSVEGERLAGRVADLESALRHVAVRMAAGDLPDLLRGLLEIRP